MQGLHAIKTQYLLGAAGLILYATGYIKTPQPCLVQVRGAIRRVAPSCDFCCKVDLWVSRRRPTVSCAVASAHIADKTTQNEACVWSVQTLRSVNGTDAGAVRSNDCSGAVRLDLARLTCFRGFSPLNYIILAATNGITLWAIVLQHVLKLHSCCKSDD